jgi:DeoR family transcriptional regulator, copper-sensing transcriptional repressor
LKVFAFINFGVFCFLSVYTVFNRMEREMANLSDRQQNLLEWLRSQHALTMAEIQERFSVSIATAYRDMRALVQAGLAQKTSEGLKLPPVQGRLRPEGQCFYCGSALNERSAFQIQLLDGVQRNACCAHCGLLVMDEPGVVSALAGDFLYGRMVNVRQAVFLLGSRVNLCCDPSVLCFASQEDARAFQGGFGGQVCLLGEAIERLKNLMRLDAQTGFQAEV